MKIEICTDVTMIDIPAKFLLPSLHTRHCPDAGLYSYVVHDPEIAAILEHKYGRPDLCLKVFRAEPVPLTEFYWGESGGYSHAKEMRGVLLTDCTKAQNVYAMHGLAPRVYGIELVNGTNWAQVTDYVKSDGKKWNWDTLDEVTDQYAIELLYKDHNAKNFRGSKVVDWQYSYLGERYEEDLIRRCDGAAWGLHKPYQQITGFEIDGLRDTSSRVEDMRWDGADFADATVLDVGCNLGAFCLEASNRGAKRVVGVDLPDVANLAYEVANWHGYWNLDYLGLRLPGEASKITSLCGIDTFDIILCLSVRYTKPARWIPIVHSKSMYFEGHRNDSESPWRSLLEKHFSRVELLGMTRDCGPRPLFRCRR